MNITSQAQALHITMLYSLSNDHLHPTDALILTIILPGWQTVILIYRWENYKAERLSNLSNVTLY